MIQKTIHYCWFGRNPLPESALKCIESWKKYCPGYEIKEWNESNFDVNCCQYVKEAYQSKKWAFVSDYCRFYVLYNYGGIYMDTDVEVIKPLDGLPDTFAGFDKNSIVCSGLIRAALPHDEICALMLKSYHNDTFILPYGLNLRTVCDREMEIFKNFGLKMENEKQIIKSTVIYPSDYFDPKDFETGEITITPDTYAIHHYDSSWYSETEMYSTALKKKLAKFLPRKTAGRVAYIIAQCKYKGIRHTVIAAANKLKRKIIK